MPIYEYQCNACGTALEVVQRITESPLKTCTSCGQDALEKLISASAFHLKGGGWYSDLYSSTSKSGGDKAAKPAEGGDKTAAKPADKPASTTSSNSSTGSGGTTSSSAASA